MKVVVVAGSIIPEQHAIWQSANGQGADIALVGAQANPYSADWPWLTGTVPGIPTTALPVVRLSRNSYLWWWHVGLRREIDKIKPDIVHVIQEPWTFPVINVLTGRPRRKGIKVVVHSCDNIWWHGSKLEQGARFVIARTVLRSIDGFVSWNSDGIRFAHRFGLRLSAPTEVAPAVVASPDLFDPDGDRTAARAAFGLPQSRPIVGFLGRLAPEKGPLDAVEAVRRLADIDAMLAVWGAGPLAAQVKDSLARDQVGELFEPLSLGDVPNGLATCDVLVVPSKTTPAWREQFGRVLVEAMIAGTPIVAYSSGAIPEVVGTAGKLVEEGDVSALAQAIREVLVDPALASELAAKGRERAREQFHPDRVAGRLVRLWTRVCAGAGSKLHGS